MCGRIGCLENEWKLLICASATWHSKHDARSSRKDEIPRALRARILHQEMHNTKCDLVKYVCKNNYNGVWWKRVWSACLPWVPSLWSALSCNNAPDIPFLNLHYDHLSTSSTTRRSKRVKSTWVPSTSLGSYWMWKNFEWLHSSSKVTPHSQGSGMFCEISWFRESFCCKAWYWEDL
jgi:hypothetical protein